MSYAPDSNLFTDLSGTIVTAATGSTRLLSSDPLRKSFYVFNDSPNVLFLKFGSGASTANYSLQVAALGLYVSSRPCPTGEIWGVWPTASGSAKVTTVS